MRSTRTSAARRAACPQPHGAAAPEAEALKPRPARPREALSNGLAHGAETLYGPRAFMRPRLHAVIALAALLGAQEALAQPKPDAAPADAGKSDAAKPDAPKPKPTPAEIAQRGQELCDRGDTEEAIAQLASALTQVADPAIASALASCEVKMKRWAAAADHLVVALRATPEGPARGPLEERLTAARAHVGTLTVTVNVEGADVFVGSRFVGQTPLEGEVFVDAGRSVVLVKRPNFDEAEQIVDVAERGSRTGQDPALAGGPIAEPVRARRTIAHAVLRARRRGARWRRASAPRSSRPPSARDRRRDDGGWGRPQGRLPRVQAAPCMPANAGCTALAGPAREP